MHVQAQLACDVNSLRSLSLSLPLQHSSFIHLCVQYKTSFFFRLPTADCDSYHKETEKRERRHAGGGGAIKENASHNPNEPFIYI